MRILIVDDDHLTRMFLKDCLKMSFPDCVIFEAATGQSALEKIKGELLDIVLCDWQLPDINGDKILEWVRNESGAKALPFLIITGDSDRERIRKAISLGVTGYIVKPLDCAQLSRRIIAALSPK